MITKVNSVNSRDHAKLTVLICTLNERDNIPFVLSRIPDFVNEVLLVDGRSSDGTVNVAKKMRPHIRVLYQPNKGKDDALMYGLKYASGDIVITLDADGSTRPEEIIEFVKPIMEGYDFAKGSRFLHSSPLNMPLHRTFANIALTTLMNLLYGTRFTDLCSGYNGFWKSSLARTNLESYNWRYEPLIIIKAKKAGLKIKEIGHYDSGRMTGKSKLPDIKQGWNILKVILLERFRH